MTSTAPFSGSAAAVRQIDVRLRTRYPFLETRIFELTPGCFLISFSAEQLDASSISREFNHHIRYASSHVTVSNTLPDSFACEVPPLADHELGQLTGLPLNAIDMQLLIAGRLPEVPLLVRTETTGGVTKMRFDRELTPTQATAVEALVQEVFPGASLTFDIEIPQSPGALWTDDILRVMPPRLRSFRMAYVEEDESFWHDHAQDIFAGRFSPDAIFDRTALGSACLVNGHHGCAINLRQALLCYDTILLQPPLDDPEAFYAEQKLCRDDITLLAELGRLKLLLAQPEERSDTRLISQVAEAAPSAVIGRRRAAGLFAADLVETADDYVLGKPGAAKLVPQLAQAVASITNTSEVRVMDALLWPVAARRSALINLQDQGLMGIGHFGTGQSMAAEIKQVTGQKIDLEALVFGLDVHAAHAFRATVLPGPGLYAAFTPVLNYMGARLNFYRAFNDRLVASWIGNEQRRPMHSLLPPVPLFDFNPSAPLRDLLQVTMLGSGRRKGHALITRLAGLPEDERDDEVKRLTDELYQLNVKRDGRSMALDHASNLADVGTAVMGIGMLPFVAGMKLLGLAQAQSRRIDALDRFFEAVQGDLPARLRPDADLDFLSRVSRVAQLRRPFDGAVA